MVILGQSGIGWLPFINSVFATAYNPSLKPTEGAVLFGSFIAIVKDSLVYYSLMIKAFGGLVSR
jgi:hypothetical protein